MFGPPTYMSPEQARDDELTSQTDVYSFGVVMYEVLAGRPPFRARGFSGLLNMILNENSPPLHELRPDVPPKLAAIFERAMEKQVIDRYQTGGEIAADLGQIIESLKVSAALIDWASIPRQMRFNKAFTRVLIRRLAETSQRLASYLE